MSKYHAKRVTQGGISFDSKAEARRWQELQILENAGEIKYLRAHPRYTIWTGFNPASGKREKIDYIPDFEYQEAGRLICEDVKSRPTITAVFRMKAKMFRCAYPDIELRIVEM